MKTKSPEVIELVRIKPKKAGAKIRDLAPKKGCEGWQLARQLYSKAGSASRIHSESHHS
jgi:hypothetical protein